MQNRIKIDWKFQNRLKNCIQDSMAQKNRFMPIKSPQKQPKRSLRRSKTPPRFPYDVPRRPKTPPRRSQERPRGLQDPSKTPPRRLQEAPKTPRTSKKKGRWGTPVLVAKRPIGYLIFGRQDPMGYPIVRWILIDVWSIVYSFQSSKNKRFNIKKNKNRSSKM